MNHFYLFYLVLRLVPDKPDSVTGEGGMIIQYHIASEILDANSL